MLFKNVERWLNLSDSLYLMIQNSTGGYDNNKYTRTQRCCSDRLT